MLLNVYAEMKSSLDMTRPLSPDIGSESDIRYVYTVYTIRQFLRNAEYDTISSTAYRERKENKWGIVE
jgi:hypothetical protein